MALVENSFLPLNGVRALVSSCTGPMQPSVSASSHIARNSIPATTSLSLPSLKDVLLNVGLAQRPQSTLPAYTPAIRSADAAAPIASQEVEVDFSAAIGALSIVDHEENQPRSRLPQRTKARASKRGRRDAPYSLGFESAFDPHTYGEDLEIHSHYQDVPVVADLPQQTRSTDRVAVTQATRARRRAATRETYDPELDLKIIRYIDLGDLWDLNVAQTGRCDKKGTAIYRCLNPDPKAPGMCSYLAAKQTVKRHVHTVHLGLR
ncbi:hypothetical protein NLJ89_g1817 [Agrocybe chaxingu]|uniref:Uncharacterized protein n=1 Tax=Agrocybe chaxingu TaxID=84603 RepID=A0A9W8MZB3_9AGAR|nr:hypothetical protein NLJ89_g1817 [Agrocybe chaxingu]